jgi:uncharacterized protein
MHRLFMIALLGSVALLGGCGSKGDPVSNSAQSADASNAAPAAINTAAVAGKPSFDCATATEPAEKLICGDPQLARMDQEVHRLYQLAMTDKSSVPAGDALARAQDEWVTARNQCGADTDPKSCIAWDYAERAHQLRQKSSVARVEAAKGISEGPVAYRCKGMDALIGATFLNADPSVVYLEWSNDSQALMQQPSGSGAKYVGKGDNGEYSLWTKGKEALFKKPGGPEMTCAEEIIG